MIDEDQNYSAKKKIGPALPAGPRCVFQCHPAFVNKNGKLSAKKSNLSAKSTLSGKKRRYLYNSDHFLKNKLISDFFVGLFPLVKNFLLDFKSLILWYQCLLSQRFILDERKWTKESQDIMISILATADIEIFETMSKLLQQEPK